MKLVFSFIFSFITLFLLGQEEIVGLRFNEQLRITSSADDFGSRNLERRPFIYIIDTIDLPFIDDFSKYYIKKYDAKVSDDNIEVVVRYLFTVNGEHPEKLDFLHEPTFSSIKTGSVVTYTPNPALYITYYDDGSPVAYDTGWTNVLSQYDQGLGLITYDTIEAETTINNTFDTLYFVQDDQSLWTTPADEPRRGGPFINNTYPINPITYGVATFDGVDAKGMPYDITSETAQGAADTLESKPINLNENMTDIFLSFFYQSGGNGNAPNPEDSLLLEFYNVQDSIWEKVWSTGGEVLESDVWSEQVFIQVAGPKFQSPGFKFRFRNYATLSGSFDQWHIDYVRLDNERDTASDTVISDVAYVAAVSSFTAPYSSVPYKHYLDSPDELQAGSVSAFVSNLGPVDVNVLSIGFEIFEPNDALTFSFFGSDQSLQAESIKEYLFALPTDQIFQDIGQETADFIVKSHFSVIGNNDLNANDTVYSIQQFRSQYSYDDGSAEKAYALTGAGLMLACKFNSVVEDTLRAIQFNFPQTLKNNSDELEFELMVWDEKEDNPIFVSEGYFNPVYTNGNEFLRFELDRPVAVDGTFHIGFRQLNADKIYIGFDVNNVNNELLYYKIGDTWYTSAQAGSLMMRPDFGKTPEVSGLVATSLQKSELNFFPNPANSSIRLLNSSETQLVRIFSSTGVLVKYLTVGADEFINIEDLENGMYFAQLIDISGNMNTTKFLVIH